MIRFAVVLILLLSQGYAGAQALEVIGGMGISIDSGSEVKIPQDYRVRWTVHYYEQTGCDREPSIDPVTGQLPQFATRCAVYHTRRVERGMERIFFTEASAQEFAHEVLSPDVRASGIYYIDAEGERWDIPERIHADELQGFHGGVWEPSIRTIKTPGMILDMPSIDLSPEYIEGLLKKMRQ